MHCIFVYDYANEGVTERSEVRQTGSGCCEMDVIASVTTAFSEAGQFIHCRADSLQSQFADSDSCVLTKTALMGRF